MATVLLLTLKHRPLGCNTHFYIIKFLPPQGWTCDTSFARKTLTNQTTLARTAVIRIVISLIFLFLTFITGKLVSPTQSYFACPVLLRNKHVDFRCTLYLIHEHCRYWHITRQLELLNPRNQAKLLYVDSVFALYEKFDFLQLWWFSKWKSHVGELYRGWLRV